MLSSLALQGDALDGGVQCLMPSVPTLNVGLSKQGGGKGYPLCSTMLLHMVGDLCRGEECQRKEMKKIEN